MLNKVISDGATVIISWEQNFRFNSERRRTWKVK